MATLARGPKANAERRSEWLRVQRTMCALMVRHSSGADPESVKKRAKLRAELRRLEAGGEAIVYGSEVAMRPPDDVKKFVLAGDGSLTPLAPESSNKK